MKKRFALFTAFLFSLSLIFTGCYDDIYGLVNSEVVLEKLGLNGNISKIVRTDDSLFLANGRVYYKTNESSNDSGEYNGQWTKIDALHTTEDCLDLTYFCASDASYVYCLTYEFSGNTSGYNTLSKVYLDCATYNDAKAGSFTTIDVSSICTGSTVRSVALIFDNQAVAYGNRHAYAKIYNTSDSAYEVYLLDGATLIDTNGGMFTGSETAVTSNGAGSGSTSCVYFPKDGADYFSSSYSMTANDTYIYYVGSYASSGSESLSTYIYYADSYDSTNGFVLSGKTAPGSVSVSMYCLSCSVTNNYLLLGTTTSGIARVALDDDSVPASSKTLFSNNGSTIISSRVYNTFVLDPSANEGDDDEYVCSRIYSTISSSSDTFSETGLYAYYKNRGSWNRDGTSDQTTLGN